ncbi:MAG: hypothetical protein LBQ88_19610 [Treponema sp.]|nr:hypothetical protein [Treponema sp.]
MKGLSNKELRKMFPGKSAGQVTRILKRLRLYGFIKKIGRTYHYYLSALGRQVITAGLYLKNMALLPALA